LISLSSLQTKKDRIKSKPSDYTYREAESLLIGLGFTLTQGSGSRVKFYRQSDQAYIAFDKPHGNSTVLKKYVVNIIVKALKDKGEI